MAASDVEICNSALHKLGATRITSLSDGTKAAILCNDQYDRLRKEVLRAHPWNFSITFASLSATVNTPVWDKYSTEFLVPSDVLRVLDTDLPDGAIWEIGNNVDGNKVIFCNDDSLKIRYIKDITNTTRFDSNFDETLAYRIAVDLAYSLMQSQTLVQNMYQLYQRELANARSFDAQEHSPDAVEAIQWTDLVRG